MQSDSKMSKKSAENFIECSVCGNSSESAKVAAAVATSDHSTLNSNATEDLKKASTIVKRTTCKACRELEYKKYELKKQQHKIERKLLVHKTLNHENVPAESAEKAAQNEPKEEETGSIKGTGSATEDGDKSSYTSVINRLPFLAKLRGTSEPPQPRIKRLKGDIAKFVGKRNDSSDWHMIQPGHPRNKEFPEMSNALHQLH